MLYIILCDDDETILKEYRARLEALADKHDTEINITCFDNAEKMLFALEDAQYRADILYLDVQMPRLNGIDAAKKLRALGCRAQLIFLTNAREYVFESFDAAPLQYLLKGEVSDEKFEQVFLHAKSLAGQDAAELFDCERGAERRAVPIHNIVYFEVTKRIVTIHYDSEAFEFYSSMAELEKRLLKRNFVRTHRAFLVNAAHIRRLGQEILVLTDGSEVPLGRTYAKQVRETLSRFLSTGGVI